MEKEIIKIEIRKKKASIEINIQTTKSNAIVIEKRSLTKIKNNLVLNRIFFRSSTETMIKNVIILSIALNFLKQTTSYYFTNLHINDYIFLG